MKFIINIYGKEREVTKEDSLKCKIGFDNFLGIVNIDTVEDINQLIEFVRAGVNAYEDWKVNGD